MKRQLIDLEQKNVFIHTRWDHYDNGSNLCFSIEFRDYKEYHAQTGWYNDNHTFGDGGTTIKCAIKLAYWFLEDPERIKNINGKYNSEYNLARGNKIKELIDKYVNNGRSKDY